MLVQNFFQVEPKSSEEIQAEMKQGLRTLRIDPDAREKERSSPENSNPRKSKGSKSKDGSSESGNAEKNVRGSGSYEVYNNRGVVVRLQLSG